MTSITEPLHDHHKFCDDLFADAEDSAQRNDWNKCRDAFERFRGELEAHFSTEENDLFPAFERTTGMTGGPTHVMRIEHAQMRDLMAQLSAMSRGGGQPVSAAFTAMRCSQVDSLLRPSKRPTPPMMAASSAK